MAGFGRVSLWSVLAVLSISEAVAQSRASQGPINLPPPAPGSSRGENFSDKPPAQLFASDCTGSGCHRGPQGLSQGRGAGALATFLRAHYTNSQGSAQALAGYLISVGGGRRELVPERADPTQTRPQPAQGRTPRGPARPEEADVDQLPSQQVPRLRRQPPPQRAVEPIIEPEGERPTPPPRPAQRSKPQPRPAAPAPATPAPPAAVESPAPVVTPAPTPAAPAAIAPPPAPVVTPAVPSTPQAAPESAPTPSPSRPAPSRPQFDIAD